MFSDIKNNTLIITNSSYKKEILESFSKDEKLHPITFMNPNEFISNYFFTYEEDAIYYLMKKYQYKYDVAKVYLDNLIYVEDKEYPSDKLNHLVHLKKELESKNLLIYNELFPYFLKGKDIIAYNIYPDKYMEKALKKLNALIINKTLLPKKINVFSLDTLKEEVQFVFNEISKLLQKNIPYQSIKLINITEEYYNEIERLEKFYNIKINLNKNTYYETEIVSKFILLLKEEDKISALEKIKEIYKIENNQDYMMIYNKIITICNKLINVKEKEIFIEMFKSLIKKENIKKTDGIEVISLTDSIKEDDYVFILGFNQFVLPKTYKDEEYITDNLKKWVDLYSTTEKNKLEKEKVKILLSNINHLTLTYKKVASKDICYPSSLIDDAMFVVEEKKVEENRIYSKSLAKLNLGIYLDHLKKYGEKDKLLDLYYHNLKIDYDTYDNSYKKINNQKFLNYLNHKLLLSYTSMNDYYKCSFKYYLNYVLKINKFEDTLQIFIGNLFHYILSICNKDDFDFDKSYEEYLKKRNLNPKEKFFVNKLKKELLFIIETIKEQMLLSDLKNALYEENIYIKIDDVTTFNGKIDKILYKEIDGLNYIAIVDYKTGSTNINLDYINYGIGLQLPVYLYVIKKSNTFNNILFTGFYLQKILNNEINITKGKSYLELKKENLKWIGYSSNDTNVLSKLDRSYENSEMIKSMKVTSKGFYHYAKVMSKEEMDALIKKVEEKIHFAAKNILNADFAINPKIIDGKNVGCEFCKYKDICFVKEEDKIYINTKEENE